MTPEEIQAILDAEDELYKKYLKGEPWSDDDEKRLIEKVEEALRDKDE